MGEEKEGSGGFEGANQKKISEKLNDFSGDF